MPERISLEPYEHLMVYKDRQEVPVKELVAKLKVSEQVLGAYLAAAQRSTTIYSDLRQAGYSDEDLPAWFARGRSSLLMPKSHLRPRCASTSYWCWIACAT